MQIVAVMESAKNVTGHRYACFCPAFRFGWYGLSGSVSEKMPTELDHKFSVTQGRVDLLLVQLLYMFP